jgi:Protein of unknown function (DUF2934)
MRDYSEEKRQERATDESFDPRRAALLAHEFWRARGCPEGSPDEDWFLAEEQLRHHQNFSTQRAA